MISSNNVYNIEDMYSEYAIWRFFTGDRAIQNQYFDQASLYCTSSLIQMPIYNLQLQSELGGNRYIDIPNYDLNINLETENDISVPAILIELSDGNNIFSEFELFNGSNNLDIDNASSSNHVLLITSGYSGNELSFDNMIISLNIFGDANNDSNIDVLDIVSLVDLVLFNEFYIYMDLNEDEVLNVIDIVQLISLILTNEN